MNNYQTHRDIAYVTNGHPRQTLDLYVPDGATNLPLLIWIHGGAFRMGSKADRVPLGYLAEGYAVACLNYRLSQHALFRRRFGIAKRRCAGCGQMRPNTTLTLPALARGASRPAGI